MAVKTIKAGVLAVAVIALALAGCDRLAAPELNQPPDPAPVRASEYPITTDIIAGQHTDVGDITIHFTYDNIFVTYTTTGNWYLTETHVHIATSLEGIPHSNGGMIPGQFDYKECHDQVQTYMYTIPMRDAWRAATELYLAAHCVVVRVENGQVVQEETGWGEGPEYPGRNWGMYVPFRLPKLCKLPTFPIEVKLGQVYKNIPKTMWLRGIPTGQGYYVSDGEWPSFCLQTSTYIYGGRWYWATLIPSTSPVLPNVIKYGIDGSVTPYDKINYLINAYASVHHVNMTVLEDLQNVFWHYRGYKTYDQLTAQQKAYADEANMLGCGYYPPPGGYIAVFLWIGESVQLTFIQVDP